MNFQAPAQGNAVDEKAQPYELRDGLATVRIHGTMLRQVSPRQKAIAAICGVRLCSMEETASALLQAAADPAVHTILLDMKVGIVDALIFSSAPLCEKILLRHAQT